jgi:CCR4-NOT transcription complex subunit 6
MLSVLRVHLPSDIPIAGCELLPYVLLRRPDTSITTDDVPASSPVDGYHLRCRWYDFIHLMLANPGNKYLL